MNISYMADEVLGWLRKMPADVEEDFKSVAEHDLIQYHHTLGRNIRNHFKLWENEWTPTGDDTVDTSPEHPDAVSMAVIREVWKRVQ
jgi:hypothetical protein